MPGGAGQRRGLSIQFLPGYGMWGTGNPVRGTRGSTHGFTDRCVDLLSSPSLLRRWIISVRVWSRSRGSLLI